MKKLINLIALVMLVSVNVLAPFSYAQVETSELIPGSELETVDESFGESGETPEINEETSEVSEEIPEANSEEKGELEQGSQDDETPEDILPNVQDDVETPAADETENVDTENNEEDQPEEETSENKIQDEEEKIEELEKVEKAVVMDIIPGTIVTLLPGTGFNSVIKTLANGGTKVPYTGVDNNIYSFERVDELPAGVTTGEISIAGAEYPVHAWFSGGILYYTTQAEIIQLNEDSQNMFQNFGALTELDLSDFDTRNVTNMYGIFAGLSKLEELNLSGWDFSNTSVNMMNMTFGGLPLLKKINMQNTKFSGSLASAFAGLNKVEELNLSGADTSNVMGMGGIFNGCTKLGKLNLNGWYFTGNLASLFAGLSGLSEISLNGVDTKGVTNMGGMFSSCSSLTGLDLSNWDTSNVMSMGGMFGGCKNLKSLNLSGWNFEKINATNFVSMLFGEIAGSYVTQLKDLNLTNTKFSGSMEGAFSYKNLENLILDGVDTSRVTNMNSMFYYCSNLTGLDLSSFDTSRVTNMNYMFEGCSKLENLDVSSFDTSNVTGMIQMFKYYNGTSLDLSNFYTSNVTNMNGMFAGCWNLEKLNLSGWDFRKVTGYGGFMDSLGFYGGSNKLKSLDMTNVVFSGSMANAFQDFRNLEELKLDGANTSNVNNMKMMFYNCNNLIGLDLSSFNTSNVTDMQLMFSSCRKLTGLDLSNFDTSRVTNMSNMFNSCSELQYLNLDGRSLTGSNYGGMFNGVNSLKKISARNRTIPERMSLNLGCENSQLCAENFEIDVSNWDLSRTKNLNRVFANSKAKEIKGLDTWNTSMVTGMNCMFLTCKLTGLDLSNWDTSNVTDMTAMFNSCSNLENLNLDNWSFAKNPKMSDMFGLDNNLKNISMKNWTIPEIFTNAIGCRTSRLCATGIESVDVSYWDLSQTKVLDGLFGDLKAKEIKGLNTWDTSNMTVMSELFSNCSNLTGLDLSTWDTSNVTTMGAMFSGCNSLTGLDLSNFDTSNVASMGNMFKDCSKLEDLNLSGWDFRNINNASLMMSLMGGTPQSLKKLNMTNTKYTGSASYAFGGLTKLEELNLDGADTRGVTNMNAMFNGDSNLTGLDLSSFDISNVTSMGSMFGGCNKLENLNLSGWDFRNVSNASLMSMMGLPSTLLKKLNMTNTKYTGNATYAFGGLNKLEELSLDGADTSNVTSMNAMFNGDSNLKILDLGGLDTSNVKDMSAMFYNCSSLTGLDLSSWDTSNVTNMPAVFLNCGGLIELDLSNWDTSNVTYMHSMFYGDQNLKTIYASDKFVTTALSGNNSSDMMFTGTISLIGGNGTKFDPNYIDEEYAKIDKVGQTGYFTDKNAINVKFINTLDGTETTSTFAKGQKLTPPPVNGYHAVGGYLDEAMTQAIDLNKGVDTYTVIYVKYDRNGSSGGGGGGGSSKKTDEDTHGSAEDSQKNTQDDKNTENVIQSDPEHSEWGSEEASNTPVDSSDKSSEGQEILSPSDNSFTKEQKDAYTFAKENGITTKDTIQSAQMNGKLTRIAMAKMLSQYAINVLGQTPDTSKTVKFKDVTNKKDADYDNGVTLAYQLGIMGQNMPGNKFRPNDEVSRAEFATALSRLLYQTTDGEYKSTKEYYIPHMAKLYNEGIISNTDPSMSERRGYVMIMLMRSAE